MLLIIILINLNECLIEKYTGFSYSDEIICLLLGISTILFCIFNGKLSLYSTERRILSLVFLLYCIGAISTLIFNYQNNIMYGLLSGIFTIKAFISYFFVRICFKSNIFSKQQLKIFLKLLEFILRTLFLLVLIDRIYLIFPQYDYRFGIRTTALIFDHPTQLASFAIMILLLSYFLRKYLDLKMKSLYINLILGSLIVLVAGRTKAIAFLFIFIFYLLILPFIKRIKLSYIIVIIPILIAISWDRINNSLFATYEARGALYRTSIIIANNHFPFGSGFATFGTEFSRRKYSLIYSNYNIDNVWGLSESHNNFITDTTWPAIIGETGYIGTIVVLLIFILYIYWFYTYETNRYIKASLLMPIMYVLIESIGESILMTSRGMTLFIILGFMVNLLNKET